MWKFDEEDTKTLISLFEKYKPVLSGTDKRDGAAVDVKRPGKKFHRSPSQEKVAKHQRRGKISTSRSEECLKEDWWRKARIR